MEISIKDNIADFMKELDAVAKTQIPIATAWAINDLAERVILGEMDQIVKDFPTATPFTRGRGAWGKVYANKASPFATIFMKDIQATYLQPYDDGGMSVPTAGGAMIVPKGIGLNQYGNIPKGKIKSLKGLADVFSGSIKTKSGQRIGGVFQRISGAKPSERRLKILVRFADPWSVKQRFDFEARARKVVEDNVQDAMEQAMIRALGSMR